MSTNRGDSPERSPLLAKAKAGEDAALLESHKVPRRTRYCILVALWVGTFFCNLSFTMASAMLPSITSEFKESNQASWIGTAYLLSSCTFTPLYGRLCIILGRRASCQFALVATILGTLLCGISRGMIELTIARFIAGIGAGALQVLPMVVSADMYSVRERSIPQAISNLFLAMGLGLGGPMGGILNDLFGWRMAFLGQVPLLILVLIVVTNTLRYVTPGQGQSPKEVLSRVDFGGLFTLFLTIGSTLVWLSMKFNEALPWSDLRVAIPLTLSLLSFGFLVVIESCLASEPILPPSLLKERVPVLVSMSNYFLGASNVCIMYFIPLWFQTVALDSASVAGLHLLPHSFAMCLGALLSGWWVHRTGKYTVLNLVFGFLPFFGLVSVVFMREDSGFIPKWFSVFPIGLGNATVFLSVLIALQAHLPESSIPFATAVAQLFRGLGQISSIAVASAVFESQLDVELHQRIHVPGAEKIISEIRHSLTLVGSLPPNLQRAARDAYAASLRTVFIVGTIMMLIAYAARLPIPEAPPIEERSGHAGLTGSDAEVETESRSGARV